MMNDDQTWREIRGTDAEKVLMAAEDAGGGLAHRQAAGAVGDEWAGTLATARLRELGLTSPDEDYDAFRLSEAGRRLARKFMQSRIDGPERWDAVQRAVLVFIRDKNSGRAIDLVSSDGGIVDGRPVTEDEVLMAYEFLSEHGLAKSIARAWGAPDLQPKITSKGMYAIHEPNIREYVERGFVSVSNDYSTNTNVNGGTVGAVMGGSGNTTNVQLTIYARTQVLALTERILSEIPDDAEHAPLRAEVESIRSEAESGAGEPESLLAKAGKAALMAGGTAAGQQIISLLAQLGQAIAS